MNEQESYNWFRILPSEEGGYEAILTRRFNGDVWCLSLFTEQLANYSINFPENKEEICFGFFDQFESAEDALKMFTQAAEESQRQKIAEPRNRIILPGTKH